MTGTEPPGLEQLLATLGQTVRDRRVLEAIRSVPRPVFVPSELRARSWENVALPIGSGQTISQPLVVARMLELLDLRGTEWILDIGTGSGYHAALLAHLGGTVISVERHARLSRQAGVALAAGGVENVELVVGDGSLGLPERAPFDAINVAAAGDLKTLREVSRQLAPDGRLVAPLADDAGRPEHQRLVLVRSGAEGLAAERWEPVRFVPLVSGGPPG